MISSMKITLPLLLFALGIGNANAQSSSPEIISSAGNIFQGNSIQIDWTLGELAIATIQNSSQQITQGFHQPNYTITSVNELPVEIGQIQVYPNPATDLIKMSINFNERKNVKTQLFDLNGRLLWTIENSGTQIEQVKNIAGLSNGTYFLHFSIEGNANSQSFKIQKSN